MPTLAEVITLIEGRVTCIKVGLEKPGSFLSSHSLSFSSELSAGLAADQALGDTTPTPESQVSETRRTLSRKDFLAEFV